MSSQFADEFDALCGTRCADAALSAATSLRTGQVAVLREHGSRHLTASCLLLTPPSGSAAPRRVALTLHAKSGQWRQFGGHVELGDTDLRAAAERELAEESGCSPQKVCILPTPLAIRSFTVGSTACAEHIDVLFAAFTVPPSGPLVELPLSADAAWWSADVLPPTAAPDLRDDLDALIRQADTLFAEVTIA